jgi:hypothetical protein
VDAVVHAAATFTQDMGEVDNGVAVLKASFFSANVVHPGMSYVRDGSWMNEILLKIN